MAKEHALFRLFLASALLAAGPALAECPASAPGIKWAFGNGDKMVNAAYLEKLLVGRKALYEGIGTETYFANGRYRYVGGGTTWNAPDVRFYPLGVRCIDYPDGPRFDVYVVNDGKLVLITSGGDRVVARVSE